MTPTHRRPLSTLTAADLGADPLWGLASGDDEDDDPAYEPFRFPRHGRAHYLVAASATLADGRSCPGFVAVAHLGDQVEVGPLSVFVEGRQVAIEASSPYRLYQPSEEERPLLPLRWTAAIALEGEAAPRSGTARDAWWWRMVMQLRYQSRLGDLQRKTYRE